MRKAPFVALSLMAVLVAGCRVKETKDETGKTKYEVEPAKVEVQTESTTVQVPKVQIVPDTTKKDTLKR